MMGMTWELFTTLEVYQLEWGLSHDFTSDNLFMVVGSNYACNVYYPQQRQKYVFFPSKIVVYVCYFLLGVLYV